MSPYREQARPICAHRWAVYWRPLAHGVECVACSRCGAHLPLGLLLAWTFCLWSPGLHFVGRPPSP